MTKRPASSLTPLVDDPTQPEFLRELVQAGRQSDLSNGDLGYDFEAGFKKHLALIASGAPMPPWAQGLPVKGAPSAPMGPGAATAGAAGSSVVVGWLTGAAVGVAVVSAAWLLYHPSTPAPKAGQVVGAPMPPAFAPAAPAATPAQPLPGLPAPADGSSAAPTDAAGKAAAGKAAATQEPRPDRGPELGAKVQHGGRPEAHTDRQTSAAPASSDVTRTGNKTGNKTAAKTASPVPVAPIAPSVESAASSGRPRSQQGAERPQMQERPQAQPQQPVAQPVAAADAKPVAQEDGRLEREMAMLSMAQRVLSSDPRRTLSLARQGEAEFSGSMFTQERQQLLLLALVKLGELDEARRLAKPFLQRYPTGPFSERVRHALASGSVER